MSDVTIKSIGLFIDGGDYADIDKGVSAECHIDLDRITAANPELKQHIFQAASR